MPRQFTFLGRPIPHFGARRLSLLLFWLSLLALFLIATLTSSVPSGPSLSVYDHKIPIPQVGETIKKSGLNPFRQPSHPPPRQKDDENIGSSWWADWNWLSVPFSNSVTKDDDRALLPYLTPRQPIYCYYDATVKKTKEDKDAESALLLTWRRAWWARGFKPMILSASEAMNNPLYQQMQQTPGVSNELKDELMRWMAWGAMDGGLLSQQLVFPMGVEYHVLPYLRRGQFPTLTRWENLGSGLFAGGKDDIQTAIRRALESDSRSKIASMVEILPPNTFSLDKKAAVLAYYSRSNVDKKYPTLFLDKQVTKGSTQKLNQLITAHLQTAWQNSFPSGIEVVKPFPEHTTAIVSNALKLAKMLASCPESPLPGSCPPNLPHCKPCGSTASLKVTTPAKFHDSTQIFSIGTVPHPWTFVVLNNMRDDFDAAWIQQKVTRDAWIEAVTKDIAPSGSSIHRVMAFKEAVANETSSFHSLWVSAERDFPADLDFYFGFPIPKSTDTAADDKLPNETGKETSQEIEKERGLFERAKKFVALSKATPETKLRKSMEAWSIADAEAWKFTRALQARRQLERANWEKEEARYSRGSGSEGGRTSWNRWGDQKESG